MSKPCGQGERERREKGERKRCCRYLPETLKYRHFILCPWTKLNSGEVKNLTLEQLTKSA